MLTQVEMAQSILDNDGSCLDVHCTQCPFDGDCTYSEEDWLGVVEAYLNTKTRRKPAFKRLSSRKTYQPEEPSQPQHWTFANPGDVDLLPGRLVWP